MQWFEVAVHTTEEAVEMVAHFYNELGAGGVSIEESTAARRTEDNAFGQWYELEPNEIAPGDAIIKGYFPQASDVDQLVLRLKQSIRHLHGFGIDTGQGTVQVREVSDEDWATAWKQYFKPKRISSRITVKPTWEPYVADSTELIIELDPGMAFGTGTHPTTALCLQTLEQFVRGGETLLDVGTGSGILAVGAIKLGAKHVYALDLDPVAVSSAKENARVNGLEQRITVLQSDLLSAVSSGQGIAGVQIVIANILAEIIVALGADVFALLEQGGLFIASGIISEKAEWVKTVLEQTGFRIESLSHDQGWAVIAARKG